MQVKVVQLYRCGQRRSREELKAETPMTGELLIVPYDGRNPAHKFARMAVLYEEALQYRRCVIHPIFDPTVIEITRKGLRIGGCQIAGTESQPADEVRTAAYLQEWWVTLP